MKNVEIAGIFNNIADLLEIRNENPFRIRAYRRAALVLESLGRDVSSVTTEVLLAIPGIGHDLASKIAEFCSTGRIKAYDQLKIEMPEGLVALLGIPGLGPKTVGMIYDKYRVQDIEGLERLAREHKLISLPGIKEKTEMNIIKGIEMIRRRTTRHPLGRILPVATSILDYLSEKTPAVNLGIAGSIRRWRETVRDIDIIATSKNPAAVMREFVRMPMVTEVLAKGKTKSSVAIEGGLQVDIRVVQEESYGAALAYFTGSKAHNIRLRELASRAGLRINEYGVFREEDGERIGGRTEEDIYSILGLQYVPPEMREDSGEIEAALRGDLPKIIEQDDIRGDLHLHSNWSDGRLGMEELIEVLSRKGYEYGAVTDHSKGLGIARGLTEERVMAQKREIDALNRKSRKFRLLAGAEVNVGKNGAPDLDEEVLKKLDVVIASIHSGFRQSSELLTSRVVKAMNNPHVTVIGHPTGRLLGERDAYELDMQEIIRTAAATGTALEINAYPLRLDLADHFVRAAKEKGVSFVINTDSHAAEQVENMIFGVAVARRGWLEQGDVLNTLSCGALLRKLNKKHSV